MLAPSKARTWTQCPLSGSLDNGWTHCDPSHGTDSRREGRAAHWVAQGVLHGTAASAAEFDGETAPNGWTITTDMVNHAQGYVDFARSLGPCVHVEQPCEIGAIRGRWDACSIDTQGSEGVLRIADLKYGWRIVEAEEAIALLCYACSVWDGASRVELWIYQPRPAHPDGRARAWCMTADEMRAAWVWLMGKATEATQRDAPGRPGAHCGDCQGRSRCHAFNATVLAHVETVEDMRIIKMTPEQLGANLAFLRLAAKMVTAKLAAVEAETEGRMSRGEYVPGWLFDTKNGDRRLNVEPETIELVTGVNPYKQVLMSPAELEREGVSPETLKLMTYTPTVGRKLVPATKRYFDRMFPK